MSASRKVSKFEYLLAIGIRFVLVYSSFKTSLQDRVEISTPLNSWRRLLEGICLYNKGVDPYSGDLFHESPLTLIFFRSLLHYIGPWLEVFFISIDILTAYLLYISARTYIGQLKSEEDRRRERGEICKCSTHFLLGENDLLNTPAYVCYAYLFNPYIILNCVGFTTTVISNVFLAGIFYALITKKKLLCVSLLPFLTLQSFYPALLIVPICIHFHNSEKSWRCIISTIFTFITVLGLLFGLCFYISGSSNFIEATYGFILNVNDLTPNIGLFWYFFTEMFEHFRALFIAALQINATILYLPPLALHLKGEPVFLCLIMTALTAVFKSYPSLGDVGFYLSLLPMWKHLFFFMQQSFIVLCILIVTSILGPTVWHLWIYSDSANANFYFGMTLAFATAQIFLITDLLFAHKKRDFALKHGLPEDPSKSVLVLE